MTFVADRVKRTARDADRGIVIRHLRRYTGTTTTFDYSYQRDRIEFEFKIAPTYQDRIVIDKFGIEHTWPKEINVYIIERELRKSINQAYRKAGLTDVTDEQYDDLKSDLQAAIGSITVPEVGVSFINSTVDKGLIDNPRIRV